MRSILFAMIYRFHEHPHHGITKHTVPRNGRFGKTSTMKPFGPSGYVYVYVYVCMYVCMFIYIYMSRENICVCVCRKHIIIRSTQRWIRTYPALSLSLSLWPGALTKFQVKFLSQIPGKSVTGPGVSAHSESNADYLVFHRRSQQD